MVTRDDILSKAADDCMKELYTLVQPSVEWDDFVQQCKDYSVKYKEWESIKENRPKVDDYCGPRPFEMYYLPRDVMKRIFESYVHAYKMEGHQELLDTIKILKDYCEEPIVDKYIDDYTDETGLHHPGYRSYDYPKSLPTVLIEILGDSDKAKKVWDKMKEFLDMAGNFFNWNRDLNAFSMTIYMGASPTSNKERVIENWKKYKGIDITIDDNKYKDDDDDDWYDEEDDNSEEN